MPGLWLLPESTKFGKGMTTKFSFSTDFPFRKILSSRSYPQHYTAMVGPHYRPESKSCISWALRLEFSICCLRPNGSQGRRPELYRPAYDNLAVEIVAMSPHF